MLYFSCRQANSNAIANTIAGRKWYDIVANALKYIATRCLVHEDKSLCVKTLVG